MTFRVIGLAAAAGLLWTSTAAGLMGSGLPPNEGLARPGDEQARPPAAGRPRGVDPFDAEPKVDDATLVRYIEALNSLVRIEEFVRQEEARALREAGLSEEEFAAVTERILEDPQVRARFQEQLARLLEGEGRVAGLEMRDTLRR